MRNPIRLKNLRLRFLPFFLLAGVALVSSRPTPGGFVAGGALVVAGASLRTWGAGHLVKNDRLTISGPYAHLRHPLYLGTLLVAAGFALIAGGIVSLALLALFLPWFFLAYFPRKDRVESARLEERYGDAYSRYRGEVSALCPSPSPWRPPPTMGDVANPATSWDISRYNDNNELGTLIALLAGLVLFALRVFSGPGSGVG